MCLNADRYAGQVRVPQSEIWRELGKAGTWTEEALAELAARCVCQWMEMVVEITDSYWPYEKQPSGGQAQEYVAQVRQMLLAPACVRKYTTLLGNGVAWAPIASLSYFTGIVEEVRQTNTPDSYWVYIYRKLVELKRQWLSRNGGAANRSAG